MNSDLLTTVFMRLRPRLMATAQTILAGSEPDAMDALQDAFCRLWGHRDSLQSVSHAEGVTVTAVRHAAIDALRRRRDVVGVEQLAEEAEDADSADDLFGQVERLIETALSERDRKILYMRDRYGYDMESIARQTGLTEANVRVVLSRARRAVRECYRKSLR